MANRRLVALPSFSSVAPGTRATLNLPVGSRKYHKVQIQYKDCTANQATIEAALKTMLVKVNGKIQRDMTVAVLNQLNAYRGRAFQTGTVTLFFSEPTARTWQGEEVFGWGTYNVATLSIEIDIDAAAVAPALSAIADIEDSNEPLGAILKVRHGNYQTTGATTLAIRDLPRDPLEGYARFHILTANASAVQLKADSDVIVEKISRAQLAAHYAARPQSTIMQAGVLTLDMLATLQMDQALPMRRADGRVVQDFPLEVTVDAASSFELYTEVVGLAA